MKKFRSLHVGVGQRWRQRGGTSLRYHHSHPHGQQLVSFRVYSQDFEEFGEDFEHGGTQKAEHLGLPRMFLTLTTMCNGGVGSV